MWQIFADTGGTFTDCVAVSPAGVTLRIKVLSSSRLRRRATEISGRRWLLESPIACHPALLRGFRATLHDGTHRRLWVETYEPSTGVIEFNADPKIDTDITDLELSAPFPAPVLAALMATGASDADSAPPFTLYLATTRATNALLERKGGITALVVTHGFEDMLNIDTQQRPDLFALNPVRPEPLTADVFSFTGRMLFDGKIAFEPDESRTDQLARRLKEGGFDNICVSLVHGSVFPEQETDLEKRLIDLGITGVVKGHRISPFTNYLKRTKTAVAEAFLMPVFKIFLEEIGESVPSSRFFMVNSSAGLQMASTMRAVDGLVSGPAAGVLAASSLAARYGYLKTITFDMGGTSTDTARYDGTLELQYEQTVGTTGLSLPAVALETVAAGGGSIISIRDGRICIGPESAGAQPGPACYGAGGPFTLTDANLLLGRLRAEAFSIPVHLKHAERAFQAAFPAVEFEGRAAFLEGIIALADEKMAAAVQAISVRRGYDPSAYVLTAYGGAGGIHACSLASQLGIRNILFPADAGVFSASGIRSASVSEEIPVEWLQPLEACESEIDLWMKKTAAERSGHFKNPFLEFRHGIRLAGQQASIEIITSDAASIAALFLEAYERQFGYKPQNPKIEAVWTRLFVKDALPDALPPSRFQAERIISVKNENPDELHNAYPWIFREELQPGDELEGPLVICDRLATVFVAAGWIAVVGPDGSIGAEKRKTRSREVLKRAPEAVEMELFISRFRAIVQSMGEQLQRTSVSVNIKERMDFSCALFDPQGRLVANAPHIPVHLGALGHCVRQSVAVVKPGPGDVILTNHPGFGGSHLPDLTLIAPVFDPAGALTGYVANRAHHAELGGKTPGSMPADAVSLTEEGVIFEPFLLVNGGIPNLRELQARLENARYPTRNTAHNMADILAGLASIETGKKMLLLLCGRYGLENVHFYMNKLFSYSASLSAQAVAGLFEGIEKTAEDRLDDGTPLKVTLSGSNGKLSVDFSGTGTVHPRNLNANPAIVHSVLMYVLRLLIKRDTPLNEGLLEPVHLVIPENSLLNPDFSGAAALPAVVGGNTEISQKITNLLIKALGLTAGSQATMNNVLFGDERFGYYETLGGGTGAGPGFNGASAIHSHMTNTALTDVEILERSYPVTVLEHGIRKGSGGNGRFPGGNGQRRVLRFEKPVVVSMLAESREQAPFGMSGGSPGAVGTQHLRIPGEGELNMPGAFSRAVPAGTVLKVETPGGGGWGVPEE